MIAAAVTAQAEKYNSRKRFLQTSGKGGTGRERGRRESS
jgi:hypothetical protein